MTLPYIWGYNRSSMANANVQLKLNIGKSLNSLINWDMQSFTTALTPDDMTSDTRGHDLTLSSMCAKDDTTN